MKNKSTKSTPSTATHDPEFRAAVKAELERMLDAGEIDIPDATIEGKVTARLATCEAQIKSLRTLVLEQAARLEGKPGAVNRVDALAKPAPKGKKK